MISQIRNLISQPGKEYYCCPICLAPLTDENEEEDPGRFFICHSDRENHYFSSSENYYTCAFDILDKHYVFQPNYENGTTYIECASKYKNTGVRIYHVIDDFNFRDLNSIADRIETYLLLQ